MALIKYTGPENIFTHRVPGTGNQYVFNKHVDTEITNAADVKHYLSSGGFAVKLTPAEEAVYQTKKIVEAVVKAAAPPIEKPKRHKK
jgi:hypothetical protein